LFFFPRAELGMYTAATVSAIWPARSLPRQAVSPSDHFEFAFDGFLDRYHPGEPCGRSNQLITYFIVILRGRGEKRPNELDGLRGA
jgi:hypothetical protein